MKYINAASKFDEVAMYVKGSFVFAFMIILGMDLVVILYSAFNFDTFNQFNNALPVYITALIITMLLIILRRYYSGLFCEYDVEIKDNGVLHKSPGKEIKFSWKELTEIKEDLSWFGIPTFEVYWKNNRYKFNPLLITEAEIHNQKLSKVCPLNENYRVSFFGLNRTAWKFSDGSIKALDLENSQGYLLLKKYRPDLITWIKDKETK